jgi:16S rRNA processing protein RimM
MNIDDCFYLGKITKCFGYIGEVVIYLDVDNPIAYSKMESVFLLINKKLVPFFIERIKVKPNSQEAVTKFNGVSSHEEALRLNNIELFLPLSYLPPLKGKSFYFHEVVDYEVIDSIKGNIGKIVQVIEYPANPVFQIFKGNKEVLIPASRNIIDKIDRNNTTIFITSPEGLIDIYLND